MSLTYQEINKNYDLQDLSGEEWRDIKGFEGFYQASNLGRIKGLDRIVSQGIRVNGRIMKPRISRAGYPMIGLRKNGLHKSIEVHTLIAKAFIEKHQSKKKLIVNHKNGIKIDNRLGNLEWSTYSMNLKHAYDNNLRGSKDKHPNAKLSKTQVEFIRANKGKLTYSYLAKLFNVSFETISCVMRNKYYNYDK